MSPPVPPKIIVTARDLADFHKTMGRVVGVLARYGASLTAREQFLLSLGLKGAKVQEAAAQDAVQQNAIVSIVRAIAKIGK